MSRCLFCGAYCEVKCGIYHEGYPGARRKKNGRRYGVLDVLKLAHPIYARVALKISNRLWDPSKVPAREESSI